MTFAEKFKAAREQRGMTQQQVADAVHVSKGAVSMWENGIRTPATHFLIMLADLFGVTLDTLVGRTPPGETERGAS